MQRKTLLSMIAFLWTRLPAGLRSRFLNQLFADSGRGSGSSRCLTLDLLNMHSGPVLDANQDGSVTEAEFEQGKDTAVAGILSNYQIGAPDSPIETSLEGYEFTADGIIRLQTSLSLQSRRHRSESRFESGSYYPRGPSASASDRRG